MNIIDTFNNLQDTMSQSGLIDKTVNIENLALNMGEKGETMLSELLAVLIKDSNCESIDDMLTKTATTINNMSEDQKEILNETIRKQRDFYKNLSEDEFKKLVSENKVLKECCPTIIKSISD